MSEFDDIQRLLRLKRYEHPRPNYEAYIEQTLEQLHRRQSAELIHRPLWRLALDRMAVHLAPISSGGALPAAAYATAVVVAGIASVALLVPRMQSSSPVARSTPAEAQPRIRLETTPVGLLERQSHLPGATSSRELQALEILSRGSQAFEGAHGRVGDLSRPASPASFSVRRADSPRYVIDTRPVSYDASLSF